MILSTVQIIDVTAFRWRNTYDAGELQRHADEALLLARPGDVVRLIVGDLTPAPVQESLQWAREDLLYSIEGHPSVARAWQAALGEIEVTNHG
ncbi:hypothetical protein [Arthrobacter bambusae]|uniref:hypothetical protein n=1 Tax=Arthrobacter bambusae TaxID=1338426 RepID=UPI002784F42E|nr:hypothetical protein [Arthrobacter bambusae]MDQ0030178.1 hypothetical protein [Arthrobacter bambusae]MDQ0097860.1 hypothetical protein [Arthrobacter bambusae]